MTISAEDLATNIAALTVPGLKIFKLSKVPASIDARECPQAYPVTEKFCILEDAKQLSFGPRALWQYTYTITYRYVQAPVGNDRVSLVPSKAAGVTDFISAVARARRELGVNSVAPANTPEMGVLSDPSGNQYQATDVQFRVIEFSRD